MWKAKDRNSGERMVQTPTLSNWTDANLNFTLHLCKARPPKPDSQDRPGFGTQMDCLDLDCRQQEYALIAPPDVSDLSQKKHNEIISEYLKEQGIKLI